MGEVMLCNLDLWLSHRGSAANLTAVVAVVEWEDDRKFICATYRVVTVVYIARRYDDYGCPCSYKLKIARCPSYPVDKYTFTLPSDFAHSAVWFRTIR